jgi:hypothetical protein
VYFSSVCQLGNLLQDGANRVGVVGDKVITSLLAMVAMEFLESFRILHSVVFMSVSTVIVSINAQLLRGLDLNRA